MPSSPRCRLSLGLAAVIALAASIAAAAPADQWEFQQFLPSGMFGFADQRGFRPPLAERDLRAIGETLGLDETQRETLDDLLRSLTQEFKVEWVEHRERATDAQLENEAKDGENTDWSSQIIAQMDDRARFQERQEELVESLFDDLRLVLSAEQEGKWPEVERDRRRATTLSAYALHDEESIDLVSLTAALNLSNDQRAALAPVLARYADQLDAVLAARNRVAAALGEKAATFYRDQQDAQGLWRTDPAKAQQLTAEHQGRQQELVADALGLRDACDKVRDLNRMYVREIRPLIPEDQAEEWDKAVGTKRTNPMSFFSGASRATMAIRMITQLESQVSMFSTMFGEASEGFEAMAIMRSAEPLTPTQRTRIEALEDRHEERENAIRERHTPKAQREAADDPTTLNLITPMGTVVLRRVDAPNDGGGFAFPGMEPANPEMTKEMRRLDLETLRELRGILTINQRAAICMW